MSDLATECHTCPEGLPLNECPRSRRPCGHHCNCSWAYDACCWCGAQFGEVGEIPGTDQTPGAEPREGGEER